MTKMTNKNSSYLSFRYDEERVTSRTLSNNIVSILVMSLFQHIGDFNQRIFGEVLEDRYTVKK